MPSKAARRATFRYIRRFSELGIRDVPLVGGKNASLGEMYRKLVPRGVRVPNGFAITAKGYRHFLSSAGLEKTIKDLLRGLDTSNVRDLAKRGAAVRRAIERATMPADMVEEIRAAYRELSASYGKRPVDVAVRSSATAEDLPDASFAGQQETFLNVVGEDEVVHYCQRCFASLFTDRAISYRADKRFSQFEIALSVGVQKMVRSDLAAAGVMFSIDTESGFRDAVVINGSYGLGEFIVLGEVTPDEFYVFKPKLDKKHRPIVGRKLGTKKKKLVYDPRSNQAGAANTLSRPVPKADQLRYCLTDDEVLQLARWAVEIEQHYRRPMDMEWAKDGRTGELFIVQARPETVQSRRDPNVVEQYRLAKRGKVLISGTSVGSKIATGKVQIIREAKQIAKFKPGNVLVTAMTDPDWEPIMKIASAIVTDQGGRTCHAAIISREMGIPCVVGTGSGTRKLKDGEEVTVSCAEGEAGVVYRGKLPFTVRRTNVKKLARPKTKVMMNVGNPETAFADSLIPNDGVGLAREEMIIANSIQVHPLALVKFNQLKDAAVREKIEKLTAAYPGKEEFFVAKLAEGIGRIAAAFYPRPVIVRLSDFRSNEYADLLGGQQFEPADERNPMIGWRGASRYYDPRYVKAFALECRALREVRETMGLDNVKVMVPFCRTVEEGKKVLRILAQHGLRRGVRGLELYVMCEIPSNVVLAEQFSQVFDGFSIGSNDLTQLTLGVDRDSSLVAHVYDERNDAVKRLVSQVIKTAKACKRKIGICGQAPSDFPDFAQFLVREGIDSISLTPDTVIATTVKILQTERQMRARRRR